jgi:hypothetical protein
VGPPSAYRRPAYARESSAAADLPIAGTLCRAHRQVKALQIIALFGQVTSDKRPCSGVEEAIVGPFALVLAALSVRWFARAAVRWERSADAHCRRYRSPMEARLCEVRFPSRAESVAFACLQQCCLTSNNRSRFNSGRRGSQRLPDGLRVRHGDAPSHSPSPNHGDAGASAAKRSHESPSNASKAARRGARSVARGLCRFSESGSDCGGCEPTAAQWSNAPSRSSSLTATSRRPPSHTST